MTPTGRTPSEPEMQHLREQISNPAVIVIGKDTDFAELELRMLAAMGDPEITSIILDIEHDGRGGFDFPGAAERCFAALAEIAVKEPREAKRPPPSYLRHDPTKRFTGPRT